MAKRLYRLEAQEPHGRHEWVELHPSSYFDMDAYTKDSSPSPFFEASSPREVLDMWLAQYPAYPTGGTIKDAAPYLRFRVYPASSVTQWKFVREDPTDYSEFHGSVAVAR